MSVQGFPYQGCVRFALLATLSSGAFGLIVASTIVSAQQTPAGAVSATDAPPPEAPATVRRDDQGRVSIRAVRVDRIKVDGILDELVYQTTPPIDGFIQQEPNEGEPATEKTEAWVFFDGENIYVSARCHDSHPERMVLSELRRDNYTIFQNENFTVVFDTFHDKRNGYYFQVSALGALRDCLFSNEGAGSNCDWNAVFDARVKRDDLGYSVEIVIPFKSLRYNAGPDQVWGINVRRVIQWKNEQTMVNRMPASYGTWAVHHVSMAVPLYGLEVPETSANLELKPYAITDVRTDRTAKPALSNELGADAGFDVKYGLTRSLTSDFTYNTDFAQVEDDQQQVNLTRFGLYFPEKREFFLEGSNIFDFGGGGLAPKVFFSRRIGLAGSQPLPIRAGGRVTGRTGKYTLGLLDIETGRSDGVSAEPTNFSVVRVRRDFLRRSTIGFIGTNRSLSSAGMGSNQAFGVDASLFFFQNVSIQGSYAKTRTPGASGSADDVSYFGGLSYAADRYGFSYEHVAVGKDFNPDIGFMSRSSFQRNYTGARFSPRPKKSKTIRKFSYQGGLEYIQDRTGHLESRGVDSSFQVEFQNSDQIQVSYANEYEYLPGPFAIASNVTLPVGGYGWQSMSASYSLGNQRRVAGTARVTYGSFYTGTKTALSYGGRVKVTNQALIEPSISINMVDLSDGSFNSNALSARATYMFTPRAYVSALLQANSSSHVFTTNARFRWEYKPNSEFFVVYSEGRDTSGSGVPLMQNRGFVVKLTKLFRY